MNKIYTRPKHKIIKAKYSGKCSYCNCHFPAGVPIYWDPVTKYKYHLHCLTEEE